MHASPAHCRARGGLSPGPAAVGQSCCQAPRLQLQGPYREHAIDPPPGGPSCRPAGRGRGIGAAATPPPHAQVITKQGQAGAHGKQRGAGCGVRPHLGFISALAANLGAPTGSLWQVPYDVTRSLAQGSQNHRARCLQPVPRHPPPQCLRFGGDTFTGPMGVFPVPQNPSLQTPFDPQASFSAPGPCGPASPYPGPPDGRSLLLGHSPGSHTRSLPRPRGCQHPCAGPRRLGALGPQVHPRLLPIWAVCPPHPQRAPCPGSVSAGGARLTAEGPLGVRAPAGRDLCESCSGAPSGGLPRGSHSTNTQSAASAHQDDWARAQEGQGLN